MLDLGYRDGQVKHAKNKKAHITVVLDSDFGRGQPTGQCKPGLVQDLEELIEQVALSFLPGQNEKQSLAKHGQQPDIGHKL